MQKAFEGFELKTKTPPKYHWQELALEAIEWLKVEPKQKGQVFRWFKLNESKAVSVLRYIKERNIHSFYYFAKVMSIK